MGLNKQSASDLIKDPTSQQGKILTSKRFLDIRVVE